MSEYAAARQDVIESYTPNPKQKVFHEMDTPYKCGMGGFGSGKTKMGIAEVIDLAMTYPGNRIAIMRDTKSGLKDSTQHDFFDECDPKLIYAYQKNEGTVMLVNGSEFIFRSFRQYKSSPRNQFESAIKSLNLGGFLIDEANEITEPEFLLMKGRLRLKLPGIDLKHRGILVTNPPNENHWIYKMFSSETADRSTHGIVHIPTRDNIKHLPPGYIEDLQKSYPHSWVQKFLEGEYGYMTTGRPVYDNFSEEIHCKKTRYMDHVPLHRYWDFGWRHPAVVFAQIDVEGRHKIHRELMGHNIFINDFAYQVMQVTSNEFPDAKVLDYGDPHGNDKSAGGTSKKSAIETLRELGITVFSRNSLVIEGVDALQKKMATTIKGEPAFQINKDNCPILVAGLQGGYTKTDDGVPIKDGYYEHPQDALRYGIVNTSGKSANRVTEFSKINIPSPSWGQPGVNQARPTVTVGGGAWRMR